MFGYNEKSMYKQKHVLKIKLGPDRTGTKMKPGPAVKTWTVVLLKPGLDQTETNKIRTGRHDPARQRQNPDPDQTIP